MHFLAIFLIVFIGNTITKKDLQVPKYQKGLCWSNSNFQIGFTSQRNKRIQNSNEDYFILLLICWNFLAEHIFRNVTPQFIFPMQYINSSKAMVIDSLFLYYCSFYSSTIYFHLQIHIKQRTNTFHTYASLFFFSHIQWSGVFWITHQAAYVVTRRKIFNAYYQMGPSNELNNLWKLVYLLYLRNHGFPFM